MYYPEEPLYFTSEIKQWDAHATLGIINPDRGFFTCVGYAPSKRRRCQNPINQYNRSDTYDLLDRISKLSPASDEVTNLLPRLARHSLCLHYHQNQVDSITEQWKMKISQLSQSTPAKKVSPGLKRIPKIYQAAYGSYNFHDDAYETWSYPKASSRYFYSANEQTRYHSQGPRQEHKFKQENDDDDSESKQKQKEKARKAQEEREEQQRREEKERERKQREQEKERKKREEEAQEKRRQKAQQQREERERQARDQAMRDRREWQQAWQNYVTRWAAFKKAETKSSDRLLAQKEIPWPVKTGRFSDVSRSNVMDFYRNACPDADTPAMSKFMRSESLKWHPDKIAILYPSCTPSAEDKEVVLTICRVVLEMKEKAEAAKGR